MKYLKAFIGEVLGKTRLFRDFWWNTRSSERSMKEYLNKGVHTYRLLLEPGADSTKLLVEKS